MEGGAEDNKEAEVNKEAEEAEVKWYALPKNGIQ
jgi:hypothetical protein